MGGGSGSELGKGDSAFRRWLTALAAAATASGVLLLYLDSQLTFIADDWELLVARDGISVGSVLEPFHENIVVGPLLVYKLLQAVFGMSSAMPFYVASISCFLADRISDSGGSGPATLAARPSGG